MFKSQEKALLNKFSKYSVPEAIIKLGLSIIVPLGEIISKFA